MATLDDVRRICSALPEAMEGTERFGYSVPVKGKHKGFLWSWAERIEPKKPKVVNDGVLAVVVPGLTAKEAILGSDERKFFTEPHYHGFPAVLVRLSEIECEELEDLIVEAYLHKAPPDLRKRYEDQQALLLGSAAPDDGKGSQG